MNWAKELKQMLKKYWWLLLVFLVVVPFCIHLLFKWNTGYALLKWEDNTGAMLGFYGAVLGGSIGGLGTLAAVMITTKETREIQKMNEEQLEADRKERAKEERRKLAYTVSEDVALFLGNLALYKNGSINIKEIQDNRNEMLNQLADVRRLIAENKNKTDDEKVKQALPFLESAEKGFIEAIETAKNNMSYFVTSKTPALERATVLNIKLYEIEEAKELLDRIEYMVQYSETAETLGEFMEASNDTMYIAAEFVKKYING